MDSIAVILLLIAGFLFGFISSITGIGGGVFFVSFMLLAFLIPITTAVDTSTFIILISTGVGFFSYYKQKRLHIKQVMIFASFSILGSLFSTILFIFIDLDDTILKIIFATTILIAGINMIYKAIITRRDNHLHDEFEKNFILIDHDYKTNLKKSIPLFFLAGFTANLLGIGGGIINTPSLNIILHYPIHNSTAISTGIIFFTAIYNTITKSIMGKIDYFIGVLMGIGAIFGSLTGSKISSKIPRSYLQFLVAAVLMGLAIRMYF